MFRVATSKCMGAPKPAPLEFGAAPCPTGDFRFPDTQMERAHRAALKAGGRLPTFQKLATLQVVRVRRPEAAWLREVLGGRYSYDQLMVLVAELRVELLQAEAGSALPAEPDAMAVEALVVDLQRRALGDSRFDWGEGR